MSNRYKGAVISATPPTTSGGPTGVASGAWTLEQQLQLQAAGLWPSQPPPNYVEDVFSTYLYTGNGSTQTITNNIDLSTKGGIVWCKGRSSAGYSNVVYDTINGANKRVATNLTNALTTAASSLTAFNTTGFSLGADAGGEVNENAINYVSWTFREQPKFFDVVTYTGDGLSAQQIAHSLGSVPGCVIVKPTSTTGNWGVWHRGNGTTDYTGLSLNQTTAAQDSGAGFYSGFTSTYFTPRLVEDASLNVGNLNGVTYVAYVFAHDAGGFGLTGTDNVISCGSFTSGNPSSTPVTVTLGYEPQWILVKPNNSANSWAIYDTMRGWTASTSGDAYLLPNTSGAEGTGDYGGPTATGFIAFNGFNTSTECIYIAIRRGPMAVPTTGTSVFQPAYGTGGTPGYPSSFTVDGLLNFFLAGSSGNPNLASRLAAPNYSVTSAAVAETNGSPYWKWDFQTGVGNSVFTSSFAGEMFRRAPSFFDVVCYTGTGVARTVTHNLAAVPELMIVKQRGGTTDWVAYVQPLGNTVILAPNLDIAQLTFPNGWNNTSPTSTEFTVGISSVVNASAGTYVAYLFATCPGVSKVGTYTGTGALQTINCGFAAGARFVLIKRTDSTGDWYVYDSARGISSGNDPYYLTNSDAAQVTGTNYVDTDTTGFKVTAAAPAGLNANGGTYIFLAIA